jgi:NADH-quinone oxidoreductase subunit A
MLYLVFDLEVVFLYPWAVQYDKLGVFGLFEMLVFVAILLIGYFYAWKKGALDWV